MGQWWKNGKNVTRRLFYAKLIAKYQTVDLATVLKQVTWAQNAQFCRAGPWKCDFEVFLQLNNVYV